MLPSEANDVLKEVESILQQISRYHKLTEDQQLALHSRAGLARQKIADVVKLLRKFDKAAEIRGEQ
jgi:hypothetical protein